jgi:hypothetical protein
MADKKESGEDILRAILEKGNARVREQVTQELIKQETAPAPAKKRKKSLKGVAGSFGDTKYYYGPGGIIVDKEGKPAPESFAKMFAQKEEMIETVKSTIVPKSFRAIEGEINTAIKQTSRLAKIQDSIYNKTPIIFGEIDKTIQNLTQQHETIVRQLIQQNQELQDKVIEALTGQKAATRAGGAVAPKRIPKGAARAVGGSRAAAAAPVKAAYQKARVTKPKEVKARQEAMMKAREETTRSMVNKGMIIGAGIGVAGGILSNMMGGGGITPGGGVVPQDYNGPGVAATGSAKEAIEFFQSKGWSKAQAIGIAANIEAESRFKTNALGDGGKAYGIAQWHPDRQAKFQQVYGKNIRESSFQEQLEYINWELNNSEKRAGDRIRETRNAGEAAAVVDQYYERSSGAHRQIRINIAQKYEKGEGLATTPEQTNPTAPTTSVSPQPQNPGNISAPGAAAPSGTAPGQPQRTSGDIPAGDIVGMGRWLEGQGIRVSENPSFGGVNPVHRGRGHYEGRAIDVNAGYGVEEANDPVWGPRFDDIAAKAKAAGYTVIWRSSGHYNHMHIEIPGGPRGMQGTTPQASLPPMNSPYMMPQRPGNQGIAFNQSSRGMAIQQDAISQMYNVLPIIMNNTQYVNNTRTIVRGQSFVSRPSDGFDPLATVAAVAGFAIGKGLRGLF